MFYCRDWGRFRNWVCWYECGGFYKPGLITLPGIRFIIRPVMTTEESMGSVEGSKRFMQSAICAGSTWCCGNRGKLYKIIIFLAVFTGNIVIII